MTSVDVFARPQIELTRHDDGSMVLQSTAQPTTPAPSTGTWLRSWAARKPDAVFLAERSSGDWECLSYSQANDRAGAVGQSLLDLGLGPSRPVLVLSGNSVDHAIVALGCQLVGVPVAPVSAAYSLACSTPDKVQRAIDLVTPGVVFVDVAEPFAPMIERLDLRGADVVVSRGELVGSIPLSQLEATPVTDDVERAFQGVDRDTVAKILFTSGSTGSPKGVPNTHGMLCSNQEALAAIWPFVENEPPVLVDWLPWSHTFGSNHNFNLVLRNGGSLYIDGGRPASGLFATTMENVADVRPTIYLNVPLGFAMLAQALEEDDRLAAAFFSRLRLVMYAAAALPASTWSRIQALAERHLGRSLPMTTSWGATETAPLSLSAYFPLEGPTSIGVPVPGVEVKLAPVDDHLELRVRGPNVALGYLGNGEATAEAFDDQGFYRTGDAGHLVDDANPMLGIAFDGRIGENFKLASGTWVNVGEVRIAALAKAAPLLQDAIVAGEGYDEIGLLVWPSAEGKSLGATLADRLKEMFPQGQSGATSQVARILILDAPPTIDGDEITDKGYINQRAALARRSNDVDRLYATLGERGQTLVVESQ